MLLADGFRMLSDFQVLVLLRHGTILNYWYPRHLMLLSSDAPAILIPLTVLFSLILIIIIIILLVAGFDQRGMRDIFFLF